MDYATTLAQEFNLNIIHAQNVVKLIEEGNTLPFIARYRKDMTGSIDDQVLREVNDRLTYLKNLDQRKSEIEKAISDQNKLDDTIVKALQEAKTLTEVEDIYRPFKQKKTTRAGIAIEKGLEGLADLVMSKEELSENDVQPYINEEKGVNTVQDALRGANDIIAERISDDAELRKTLRDYFMLNGVIHTTEIEPDEEDKYKMYSNFSENANVMASHRILAVNRGEKEKKIAVKLEVDDQSVIEIIERKYIKRECGTAKLIRMAIEDSYKRLLFPSLERELRNTLTDRASEQAIKTFETNLRPLLLQPPLHGKVILALDPGYRTGCKVAVINEYGSVLAKGVIYPTPPQNKIEESEERLLKAIRAYKVDVIAIGNGTASKETEIFVAGLIKKYEGKLEYAIVNEAGASVYSASKAGAAEFPEYDVTIRSAISLARRLQDPLAELIKIDVKAIGVGEYQHDMPEKRLTEVLEGVVEDCVNKVGVDLNTASQSLLSYVAGLNKTVAGNIISYRDEKPFESKQELLKVAKLGPKAFEQCAGFLRIRNGKSVLDNTGVHPENYTSVKTLLSSLGYKESSLKLGGISDVRVKAEEYGLEKLAKECGIGVFALNDILNELQKPGRDIRDSLPKPILRSDLLSLEDLKVGMVLTGTVRNVVDFGAFVDIGVHQDGLVHISQLSDKFVSDPNEVVKVGDIVEVRVIEVNVKSKKIALSMKSDTKAPATKKPTNNNQPKKEEPQTLESAMTALLNRFGRK